MSTQFAFQSINHQCADRCYRSHTHSFTGDREQHRHPETEWQMMKGMKETTIALHDDRSLPVCLSPDNALVVPTDNRLPHTHRNALPHSRCEFRDETFCNTTRMKRTLQLETVHHTNEGGGRNLLPLPRQLRVWCHSPQRVPQTFLKSVTANKK
jgi:hypothetical protein